MSPEQQAVAVVQLAVTAVLSMILGLNRERLGKSAGLRTHMLAGVGACLFTSLSLHAFPNADTSRMAANVVTGIGFLGAGAIFREGSSVRELTTAASIWATAAIGVAVAAGGWLIAIGATVLIWFILSLLRSVDHLIEMRRETEGAISRERKS